MIYLKTYQPHLPQRAFHYYVDNVYRYMLMISGIRGGKTVSGARQALKEAWNNKTDGVFGIIAPTYNMLKRTTWAEFKKAARSLIKNCNESDKIITLKNGKLVHGHSADRPDKIRNETFCGAWVDEARECPDFALLWNILLGRVLSTKGKIFVTTSPNSFDDIHKIFIEEKNPDTGVIHFPTHKNIYLDPEDIEKLKSRYDERFAAQELGGEFVIFQGSVYYCFDRQQNAGDFAFKVAQYDPSLPICLCCDFNVNPMAWVIAQIKYNDDDLAEIFVIDEIYLENSNTVEGCTEFKNRYHNHNSGVVLYGDASGNARDTRSHVTDWKIIEHELSGYAVTKRVPTHNPSEKDRINAVNGMICNSKKQRRVFVNPQKCKHLICDFEQVAYKEGSTQIDKNKNKFLTHPSDAVGYMIEKEFSLNKGKIEGIHL